MLGEVRGRSMILRLSKLRFWLKYKCQSLHITCTHYSDLLFFKITFSRFIWKLKGGKLLFLERYITYTAQGKQ